MTLRTAARLGLAGSVVPFASAASWVVAVAVAGQPLENQPFNGSLAQFALAYLQPAAMFGFLAILYLVLAGHLNPLHLRDAALASSAMTVVALAAHLSWGALPGLFANLGHSWTAGLAGIHWLTSTALVPVAWLAFLVSFIQWPGPPPSCDCCRAAGWLGLVTAAASVWPVVSFLHSLAFLSLGVRAGGLPPLNTWMVLAGILAETARWVLLCVFAVALWRMRPATS